MTLKHKKTGRSASSNKFNLHSFNEIIVYFEDDCSSDYMKEYDAFIERTGEWKDLRQAFKDKDIITDNYYTKFFEPRTDEDKNRGYTLY